jgi:hypothetical protein
MVTKNVVAGSAMFEMLSFELYQIDSGIKLAVRRGLRTNPLHSTHEICIEPSVNGEITRATPFL